MTPTGVFSCALPGADGNLVRVVDVGTAVAAVTLAEAVVVHAVLLLLLLLMSLPDYGKAALDSAAGFRKHRQSTGVHTSIHEQLAGTKEDAL